MAALVHLLAPADVDPTGQLVDVRIDAANKHSLLGSMDGGVPTRRIAPKRVGLPIVAEPR